VLSHPSITSRYACSYALSRFSHSASSSRYRACPAFAANQSHP
jgi:hypothetical protein